MKRERIDKNMAIAVINKVLYPLAFDLGSKYLWESPSYDGLRPRNQKPFL